MNIQLTRINSRQPETLTKKLWLDGEGKLQKQAAAQMVEGEAEVLTINSARKFADLLTTLKHSHALTFGLPKLERCKVYSKTKYEALDKPADAITRTKDAFNWSTGAGVMMLDYDPQEGTAPLTQQQLIDILVSVLPEIATTSRVQWFSSSSLIFNGVEQVAGIKGQRLYLLVADAQDIPRAGEVLAARLWLAGYGYYAVSRAGSHLERCLIDTSVWQSNRLDFAAGAQCTPPLEQRRGEPLAIEGQLLDTAKALPNLTDEEKAELNAAKEKARLAVADEVKEARAVYILEEAVKLVERAGLPLNDETIEQATSTLTRACEHGTLTGDFVIYLADRSTITVGEILDNPSKYHNALTLDPLEPEYNGYKQVGKLYLIGGRPNLYSHAHGGKNYRLIRQPRRIEHKAGLTTDTTATTLEYMRALPDVFDMGTELVLVQDKKAIRLTQHSLSYWLGAIAQYWKWAPNGVMDEKLIDPPSQVINQLLAINRKLKPLRAVITAPVMDSEGRIINRAGYDAKTELYLDLERDVLPVPEYVSPEQLESALAFLMKPFADFCTATALDRGVLLAMVLSAIQRPVLPTCPAFGIDAPAQGSGKTYLAQCIGTLATGEVPTVYPHISDRDDQETRKRLTAILAGGGRVIIWDNVLGHFDSAALASFLTSHVYSDRILGKSESVELPNIVLLLFTGNNLTLAGDMPRRTPKCRLDAQVENPALRKFKGNPLAFILENRQQLVRAGLMVLRAYYQSEDYKNGGAVPNESTASFEVWDSQIRQAVAWIAKTHPEYEDPANALKDAVANDPELELLGDVLEGIKCLMGVGLFEAKDLHRKLYKQSNIEPNKRGGTFSLEAEWEQETRDNLEELAGTQLSVRGLGRVLSYRVDRIAGGFVLKKITANKRTRFKVEEA